MRSYLAAAIQMTASASKEENLAKAETFVRLAAERGRRPGRAARGLFLARPA